MNNESIELCCVLSFTPGFRTVLSKPDEFWQRLIDSLSVRRVAPLFLWEGFGSSPASQTFCSTLTPVNNTQAHALFILLPPLINKELQYNSIQLILRETNPESFFLGKKENQCVLYLLGNREIFLCLLCVLHLEIPF